MLARMQESWIAQTSLVGMENGVAILKMGRTVFYNTKHVFTVCLSNCTLEAFIPGMKTLCSHKNLHISVHSCFVYNTQKTLNNPYVPQWVNGLTGIFIT